MAGIQQRERGSLASRRELEMERAWRVRHIPAPSRGGQFENPAHREAKRSYGLAFYALDLFIILLNVSNALENVMYIPLNSGRC